MYYKSGLEHYKSAIEIILARLNWLVIIIIGKHGCVNHSRTSCFAKQFHSVTLSIRITLQFYGSVYKNI